MNSSAVSTSSPSTPVVTLTSPSSLLHSAPHCSMSQNGGGSCLGPIMEIREISSFCNCCVVPDKYWGHHHHHHHHHSSSVVPSNPGRHSSMYSFYTPPPPPPPPPQAPPPQNYSAANVSMGTSPVPTAPPEWTSHSHAAEQYPHFIYHQYPTQQDYSSFLNMSTGPCYESAEVLVNGGPASLALPPAGSSQSIQTSSVGGSYDCSVATSTYPLLPPPPLITSKYGQVPSTDLVEGAIISSKHSHDAGKGSKVAAPPETISSSDFRRSSGDSSFGEKSTVLDKGDAEVESDSDDDNREVISIDDSSTEENIEDCSPSVLKCTLCRKFIESSSILPQNAPSPQLSKILENIDDDELDISVCSGDIEIGGIEDEMIEQAAEQQQLNSVKITVARLSQLIGIPVTTLLDRESQVEGDILDETVLLQLVSLCLKCKKLVGMAESLEKQLNSVLSSLREPLMLLEGNTRGNDHNRTMKVSASTQTETNPELPEKVSNHRTPVRILVICQPQHIPSTGLRRPCNDDHSHRQEALNAVDQTQFLCHECGNTFKCGRNLGKHLRRRHGTVEDKRLARKISCDREECDAESVDNAAHKIHLRAHTGEKTYFCPVCLKLFMTKSNLRAHVLAGICQSHNGRTNDVQGLEGENQEDVCNPKAPSSSISEGHETNSKLQCKICGLKFRNGRRFTLHSQRKCSKEKVFECGDCGKLFAKQSELRNHEVVHTGTKAFPCDICGLTFTTRGNQRVHMASAHLKEKRFKCHRCQKGFTRKHSLQAHLTKRHKEA